MAKDKTPEQRRGGTVRMSATDGSGKEHTMEVRGDQRGAGRVQRSGDGRVVQSDGDQVITD